MLRLDAKDTIFFAEELRRIKSEVYETEFPERQSLNGMFPVSEEADPGDEEIGYDIVTAVGIAEFIANYADDIALADISTKREMAKIRTIGLAYSYNWGEVQKARKLGKNLTAKKAMAVREGIETKLNQIIWYGDKEYGLYGILNHPNIPAGTVQTGATSGNVKWEDKTDDEILKDLFDLVNAPRINTKGVEIVDSIAMGIKAHSVITSRRLGDTTITIKQFFMDQNPQVTGIYVVPELDDVVALPSGGTGPSGVVMAYHNRSDKLSVELPVDFEQMEAEKRNLAWKVPAVARIGGILVPRPLSINIIEGVC